MLLTRRSFSRMCLAMSYRTLPIHHVPVTADVNKHAVTLTSWDSSPVMYDTNTLYSVYVLGIPRVTDAWAPMREDTDGSARAGQSIHLSHLTISILAGNVDADHPGFLHWAIVMPKDFSLPSGDEKVPHLPVKDFFKSYTEHRVKDFAADLDACDLNKSPINDDLYYVLARKKMYLSARSLYGRTLFPTERKYERVTTSVDVNRMIDYHGDTTNDCLNPIYLCFWFTPVMHVPGAGVTTSAYDLKLKVGATFKDQAIEW